MLPRRAFVRLLAAGAMAAGCGSSPKEPTTGEPGRLRARPGSPTTSPSLGLSRLGLASPRDGLLYVPTSYTPTSRWPLLIGLHGASGSAASWASYPDRAEAHQFVFLAPDARSSTWDLVWADFGPDVDFIDQALEYTFARCSIDPARIALVGFSDGASYALSLGVRNADLVTHLVAYSPGFYQPTDAPAARPHVFVSHGDDDAIIPVTTSRDQIVPDLRGRGYAVTYQEFDGGHEVPGWVSEAAIDGFLG